MKKSVEQIAGEVHDEVAFGIGSMLDRASQLYGKSTARTFSTFWFVPEDERPIVVEIMKAYREEFASLFRLKIQFEERCEWERVHAPGPPAPAPEPAPEPKPAPEPAPPPQPGKGGSK